MAVMTDEIRDIVNKLIETCHDGEFGFLAASKALEGVDPLLKSELLQYSRQRHEFAAELEQELTNAGEHGSRGGTLSGAIHLGWLDVTKILGVASRHSILVECERGEKAAVDAYCRVIIDDLPVPTGDLLRMHLDAIQRVHDRIRSLRDAANLN
jgi:uncharacterized protein (TIGR02284 family)